VRYPLSVEEALRFADACERSRFGLFFLLTLAAGLRPEECIAVQWPDLELGERGVVHVRRVIHALRGGGWRWHEPKTKNGVRSVVFPGELAAKFTEHRRRQLEQKLKTGPSWQNNDLVFNTSLGTPILTCTLHSEFKAVAKRAGLPATVSLYDLRHSFVTLSLVAGVDAKTVSQEAGHASVAFTLDHYGHVLQEMHEAASDKREQLLRGRTLSR
jgi:integrase